MAEIRSIFGVVEVIYKSHCKFLDRLQYEANQHGKGEDTLLVAVCDIFTSSMECFRRIYPRYADNYPKAMVALNEAMQLKAFREFYETQRKVKTVKRRQLPVR